MPLRSRKIQDLITNLKEITIFFKIDLLRAFHEIPVAQGDIAKIAVTTTFGLYKFTVMTFGARNAAQSFQRFMDAVLRRLEFCWCYVDDVLVASGSVEQHEECFSKG